MKTIHRTVKSDQINKTCTLIWTVASATECNQCVYARLRNKLVFYNGKGLSSTIFELLIEHVHEISRDHHHSDTFMVDVEHVREPFPGSSTPPDKHLYLATLAVVCPNGTDVSMSITSLFRHESLKFYKKLEIKMVPDEHLCSRRLVIRLSVTQLDYQLEVERPITSDLAELLETSIPSDVICELVADHKTSNSIHEFPLHKAALSVGSPVLADMFTWTINEATGNRFRLIEDISPEAFQVILRLIYTKKVAEADLEQYCAELCIFADKYQMDPFKELCEYILDAQK